MTKPHVFLTRVIPERGMALLQDAFDLDVWPDEMPAPRAEILRRARDAEGIVALVTDRIDGEVMDAAPKLRVVSNVAVGYDNIDAAAATQRKIMVTNTPGVLTETTADHGFALLLSAARRIAESYDYAKNGRWKTWGIMAFLGQDVYGATLGIAGMGRIGTAIARRAKGFNMRVLYHNRHRDEAAERELGAVLVSKEDLLRQSDFVMLALPYNADTRHYINAASLELMKPTAVLVNIARGAVVDTQALTEAMTARRIFAAALDVTDPEPLPADHPLYKLDNVTVVPHIASASVQTRNKMAEMAAQNCIAALRGERPPNLVNEASGVR